MVKINERMLNYKCKSHRGRSPTNRPDILCIIEITDRITRVYAKTIEDKRADTILQIIIQQIRSG